MEACRLPPRSAPPCPPPPSVVWVHWSPVPLITGLLPPLALLHPDVGTRTWAPTATFLSPCCLTRISWDLIRENKIDVLGEEGKQEITHQRDSAWCQRKSTELQQHRRKRTGCEESGRFPGQMRPEEPEEEGCGSFRQREQHERMPGGGKAQPGVPHS